VAQLLCFKRYFYTVVLSFSLTIYPLILHAAGSNQAVPEKTTSPEKSQPATQKKQNPLAATDLSSTLPQRALAPFAPTSRIASRTLAEDTLWNGAILIEGMVTVAAQATLTIMPGTVVRFGADSGMFVLGRIVAKGTAELPIILASQYSEPASSDWYGIVLTGTAKKNIFERVQMHGAEAAIYVRSSSLELKHLHVENCSAAIKLTDSIADLKDIAIANCSTGLSAVKSEVDIEALVVKGGETALAVASSSLTATELKISNSSQSALIAEKSQLKIEKSVFSGNLAAAQVIGCEGSFTNSRFITNSDTAVTLSGSLLKFSSNLVTGNKIGIQIVDNLASIWGNSIYANSSYNLLYLGDDMLYVGGNWFDTENLDLLSKSLFSKRAGAIQIMPLLATNPLSDQRTEFKAEN